MRIRIGLRADRFLICVRDSGGRVTPSSPRKRSSVSKRRVQARSIFDWMEHSFFPGLSLYALHSRVWCNTCDREVETRNEKVDFSREVAEDFSCNLSRVFSIVLLFLLFLL